MSICVILLFHSTQEREKSVGRGYGEGETMTDATRRDVTVKQLFSRALTLHSTSN